MDPILKKNFVVSVLQLVEISFQICFIETIKRKIKDISTLKIK